MSKVVLVTGGSRGIGANIVEALAKDGYNVILNYNNSENEARKIQENLLKQNINIDIYQADVSNHIEVTGLVNYCINKYHKIDVLINNAGISQIKLFTDISDIEWNNMIQTNLTSAFYTIKDTLPSMIHHKSGCIINISSIWGITGGSCEAHYSVSKAGLDAMTKSLAKELGPSNIRVNSIAPGIIDTSMNSHLSEEELQEIKQEIPLERIGNPNAISKSKAKGLMQIMDSTAKEIAKKNNIELTDENILDPEINIEIGTIYLSQLIEKYNSVELAIAAYNAGHGNVDKWISQDTLKEDGTDAENIPFKETNMYVRKVMRDWKIYKSILK